MSLLVLGWAALTLSGLSPAAGNLTRKALGYVTAVPFRFRLVFDDMVGASWVGLSPTVVTL